MKQEVVITDVSQCQKDIGIEVSAEEVKKEFEKTYDAYTRYVKVPGFRPGRVPRDVVKQRFSKEIKDEVVGQLLPHALQHAVADHKLRVVGEPHLKEMEISEGAPLLVEKALSEVGLPPASQTSGPNCDFYGKSRPAVKILRGPRAAICNECANSASEILARN